MILFFKCNLSTLSFLKYKTPEYHTKIARYSFLLGLLFLKHHFSSIQDFLHIVRQINILVKVKMSVLLPSNLCKELICFSKDYRLILHIINKQVFMKK
jgi:hypothetical protein